MRGLAFFNWMENRVDPFVSGAQTGWVLSRGAGNVDVGEIVQVETLKRVEINVNTSCLRMVVNIGIPSEKY